MKHSVVLDRNRCRGCTTCIKNCPTEAIRVRRGKAMILADRCIDCGRCIQVCPHHAIKAVCDDLSRLREFRYCVAVPEPVLYGQFRHMWDIDLVLNGLLKIGFHQVFESARASELLADYTARRGGPDEPSHARHLFSLPHHPAAASGSGFPGSSSRSNRSSCPWSWPPRWPVRRRWSGPA